MKKARENYVTLCRFCGARVEQRRVKGKGGYTVMCAPVTQNILLDGASDRMFYYDGQVVRGREVLDGLIARPLHKCRTDRIRRRVQ